MTSSAAAPSWHGTTILSVRKGDRVVVAGDGQVSVGNTIVKANARKVRPLAGGQVIAGFAGATADALTLFERLEGKLEQHPMQLTRACVELAKDWRTDRYLRRLEAMMIVVDRQVSLVLTGTGDVLAGARHRGDRLRRQLCAGRRAGACRRRARCRDDRPQGDGDRCRDLCLHQCQSGGRKPGNRTIRMTDFTPREIVSSSIATSSARARKRAVAIALRNRWRAQAARAGIARRGDAEEHPDDRADRRRQDRDCPAAGAAGECTFIKVEATKFTEVGYVGRDVEQMIRDLLEAGIANADRAPQDVEAEAHLNAERRVLDALVGSQASAATRDAFQRKLRSGELDDKEIEVQVADTGGIPADILGLPGGSVAAIIITDMLSKTFGQRQTRRMSVKASHEVLLQEESDKLLDNDLIVHEAIEMVENSGIVFIDEIDKISARSSGTAPMSAAKVQRDLLPLIEGTTVSTKHGPVRTDHILFIAWARSTSPSPRTSCRSCRAGCRSGSSSRR